MFNPVFWPSTALFVLSIIFFFIGVIKKRDKGILIKSAVVFFVSGLIVVAVMAFTHVTNIEIKNNPGQLTYSFEKYSLTTPHGYSANGSFYATGNSSQYTMTLLKEPNRKLVIFQAKDGHFGEGGVSIGATQQELDLEKPKKQLTVGTGENTYDVWMYYNKADVAAESELTTIFRSIVIK